MSSIKAGLKAAKAAIDAGKWGEVVEHALKVLSTDPENYYAKLFLGRAHHKLGQYDPAAAAYTSAGALKPTERDPLLGLRELYASQGSTRVAEHTAVSVQLALAYAAADDAPRCHEAVDKLVDFARAHGSQAQYADALRVLLPSGPVYGFLEGRLWHPGLTYRRLAEITEGLEAERVNREIGERRTRLGARIGEVTREVKREVYARSELEELYGQVIDWTGEDEVRRVYEEKLLRRVYDLLVVAEGGVKGEKRGRVVEMAEGMVIIKHAFALAWQIALEWKDVEEISEMDPNVLREFVEFFPKTGLAKVLKGYLASDISPFPQDGSHDGGAALEEKEEDDVDEPVPLTSDVLLLMTEGIDNAKESPLAHRLVAEYYLFTEEYESAVEISRKGLNLLSHEAKLSGLVFQSNSDALNSTLATSLIQYQTPKNHPEAKTIFDEILNRKPSFTPALIGVGLVLEEEEEYGEATDFLSRAYTRDTANIRIGAEAAWCKALNGDYSTGRAELEQFLSGMDVKDSRLRDLRSRTYYRIGVCLWELDSSKAARKDRKGAYALFLSSIKANPNYAPAYTSLGNYYADYSKDKKRARQCFRKAFELSPSEIGAAERLARSYADQGEWDVVEIIAQRVVDSGKARPPPGSKKKGVSWPFSALGVVQMNKQEYSKSVVSFLAALRISPDDYHSYVGLGESYHNSGRYNSAARTFKYAEEPTDGVNMKKTGENWFTKYMLANVNRELGEYDSAISGYEEVLKERKEEFGVAIALLQTLVERAWRNIQSGFFGQAVDSAIRAIYVAAEIVKYKPNAFNLWKALGDACAIFSKVQTRLAVIPLETIIALLLEGIDINEYSVFEEVDGIGPEQLKNLFVGEREIRDYRTAFEPEDTEILRPENEKFLTSALSHTLNASILAHKRGILSSAHDIHARAVSWYNLGWTEYQAHVCLEQNADGSAKGKKLTKLLKASMACFKKAIELEAGNAEFWNALGVVTTQLNPKVAQHCFVRSLHLNERSAATWTNLGTLYLVRNDLELAHQAFGRAQSTDPEYAHAWVGEGLIALLWGDAKEGLSHFTHAFEISDSASLITKRQYALSTFDNLLSSPPSSTNITSLIQPLFALRQLLSQVPTDIPFVHLSSLYSERIGDRSGTEWILRDLDDYFYEVRSVDGNYSPLLNSLVAAFRADAARARLAMEDYDSAITTAHEALDLIPDPPNNTFDGSTQAKIRLSTHLTRGLAHHCESRTTSAPPNAIGGAIAAFRAALEVETPIQTVAPINPVQVFMNLFPPTNEIDDEMAQQLDQAFDQPLDQFVAIPVDPPLDQPNNQPDNQPRGQPIDQPTNSAITCLLASVLWATGGADEKDAARDQLYDLIGRDSQNVDAVLLLAAIAVIENDTDAMDAARDELLAFRAGAVPLNFHQRPRVETALFAIATRLAITASIHAALGGRPKPDPRKDRYDHELAAVQTAIMLAPSRPHAWAELAALRVGAEGGEQNPGAYPAEMALLAAKRLVPPRGELDAEELAGAFAGTGRVSDGQRAVMVAPWRGVGWGVLGEAVASR